MLANWVKQSTATTGTGTITLGAAASGYIGMADAFADGDLVRYVIEDGTNREAGVGTYSAGTLARTVITEKFDGGTYTKNPATGISLSGSATVICTDTAQTHNWRGAHVYNSADQTFTTTWNSVDLTSLDTVVEDTDGFFSASAPDRLTIPQGVKRVNVTFGYQGTAGAPAGPNEFIQYISKYDALDVQQYSYLSRIPSRYESTRIFTAAAVPVSPGDYFKFSVLFADTPHNFIGGYPTRNFVKIEVVE